MWIHPKGRTNMAGTPRNRLLDNLQVDIEISNSLKSWMKHNPEFAPQVMKLGLRAVTKEGSKQVKAQIRSDGLVMTGKYMKSVRGSTTKTKSIIGSKSRIANILENGARPHTIWPKKGKLLEFRQGGRLITARRIKHPGLKAYNPFDEVWKRMQGSGQVQSLFSQGIQQAMEAIENGG